MGPAHKGLVKGMFMLVKFEALLSTEVTATALCLMTFSLPTFGTSVESSTV
jgi:hypothetical protein